jgi:hypothetical protein
LTFRQLVHGRCVDTYTSMVENAAVKSFGDEGQPAKSLNLVDLPGHERLRVAGLQVGARDQFLKLSALEQDGGGGQRPLVGDQLGEFSPFT